MFASGGASREDYQLLAEEFLYRQNEFLVVGTLLGLLLSATELGFRRGRAVRSKIEDSAKSHYWTLQAGVMGLLALLLAFTFSMAVSRYETRKQLLTDETNAIGSVYSLSRMLLEPYRSEVAKLIDKYVECRLHDYSRVLDEDEVAAANLICVMLQDQLWSQAEGVAREKSSSSSHRNVRKLFERCLRRGDEARRRAREPRASAGARLPVFGYDPDCFPPGLRMCLGNHRHIAVTATVCLLISLVILVIMDLTAPAVD